MARRLLGKRPFDFSARVPLQLGRESISSSTVAVSELIKNSYDADAEEVKLHFYLRNKPTISTIVLQDNGNGMSAATLYDHWLKIGTDFKFGTEFSHTKQRVLTGAKGLGRLGLDRLCHKVVLYTKTKGSDLVTQLIVDWRKYEGKNATMSEIQHSIYELDLPITDKYGDIFTSNEESGTYMVLIGLKDQWDREFLNSLKQELRLLISPYRSANDFSIELSTHINNQSPKKEIIDSQEILSAASWEIKAQVDNQNRVELSFKNNTSGETIKQVPVPWKHWISNQGDSPLFGPLRFDFYYMVNKKEFTSKINMRSTDWSQFMTVNQGVRIYRDDFRVRPYGEPSGKGDWLDIGLRKVSSPGGIKQGGWKIGPNQIIGAVSITKTKNPQLNDQANREGIVENDAYLQLRTFAIKVIQTFEIIAHKDAQDNEEINLADELEKTFKKSDEKLVQAIDSLTESVGTIRKSFSNKKVKKKKLLPPAVIVYQKLRELERAKISHEKALNDYYNQLEKERKQLENQKNTMLNLASIGVLTVCFGHEIKTHSAIALENARELLLVFEDSRKNNTNLDYEDLADMTKDVINGTTYVNNFSELAINNIKPDKRTRTKNNVPEIFNYIFELMKATFNKTGINWEFDFIRIKKEDFNVRSFRIDWESIAINLITNSIWAMNRTPRTDRKIKVCFERVGGTKLMVSFLDSGCGLETGQEETIFLPMYSAKVDRTGNTIGTGMGLAIIKTQVEDHMSGLVYAKQFSSIGGAGFYIEVIQD
ncbi:ATP-binding protein [Shewanella sp. SW36]|uniref:ATP-binding protein n=1 Tax=unclassified Shewanella TaxID=196818 RepID=UPI0021DA3B6B|nr:MULTISPECIES: ATP-binding protein [unclassified Shewanella]MCU7976120.1 ATP-binding protein [Shewanella sp. SW36]MCU7988923.1 ATP-binding protein [Shewanella sp. SW1]MCU8050599.1 ATP-binding protein [Shewanella sp. SM43]